MEIERSKTRGLCAPGVIYRFLLRQSCGKIRKTSGSATGKEEAAVLTERENFLKALRGEVPEYVPRYNIFWRVPLSPLSGSRVNGIGKDIYGVEWTNEGSAFEASLPKPGNFILDDIRRWSDLIKFPDLSDVDWEAASKIDLKDRDPLVPRGGGTAVGGFFQNVMNFMGFTEGLIACHEEPEEVKALVNYLCDCFLSYSEEVLKYYQPDYIMFADDIATERSPFISLECFRDIFAPVWRRYIKFFVDRGYLCVHHNCGHFEAFLDDVVDMGYKAWEPAQASNDIVSLKKKYGNKFMICGGFDPLPFLPHMNATEEQIRGAVKKLLDQMAPNGGYAFLGGVLGDGNPVAKQRTAWIMDEYEKLKTTYY